MKLNEHWMHKKLGDCCSSELGKTLDEGRNTGKYRPYLCALNVLWGKIDTTVIKQMRIEDEDLNRYLVKKGDLLVCEGGEIGRCAIWDSDDEIYYQNALHRVRFYDNYDSTFFMYLLCYYNDLNLIEKFGKGLTIKHLNQASFRSIPVSVPDLPAQRRIAAILSAADKVIEQTRQLIGKYKSIKQGMMEDLLKPKEGWKKVWLGEVIMDSYAGGTPNRSHDDYFGGEIPWVTSGEVNNPLIYSTLESITFAGLNSSSAKWIPENSILVALYGATAGQVSMLRIKATSNQAVLAIIPNVEKTDTVFLYYQLVSNKDNLLFMAQGSGQPNLSKNIVDSLEISLPILPNGAFDLTEQRRIAKILSGIDRKIEAEEKVLEKYEKMKKGLMERMLGE